MRHGEDERLPRDRETGYLRHTTIPVHTEMLLQVCRDYPGLPDPRTLTLTEIRFFYEGLREELKSHTRPGRRNPSMPSVPKRRPSRRRR